MKLESAFIPKCFMLKHPQNHINFLSTKRLGLGFKKRNYMHFSKPQSAIHLMHQIKPIFDPKKLLNPYKVLPDAKE